MESKLVEYCLFGAVQGLCMPSSDWASWVQAVGSVLAILVSAGLVLLQHWLERQRDHERAFDDAIRQMRIIQEIAHGTWKHILFISQQWASRDLVVLLAKRSHPEADVDQVGDAVAAIPQHDLLTPVLVLEIRRLVGVTQIAKLTMRELLAKHEKMDAETFEVQITVLEDRASEAENTFNRIKDHVDLVERTKKLPLRVPEDYGKADVAPYKREGTNPDPQLRQARAQKR